MGRLTLISTFMVLAQAIGPLAALATTSSENVRVDYAAKVTLESFEQIKEEYRAGILADLLASSREVDISDRDKILQKYLYQTPPEQQTQIYGWAFQIAFAGNKPELYHEFFDKAVKAQPHMAHNYICSSINMLTQFSSPGSDNPLSLEESKDRIRNLVPLIQKNPSTANELCQVGFDKKVMTIKELVALSSPEPGEKLNPQAPAPLERQIPKKSYYIEESMCTASETRSYLRDHFKEVAKGKPQSFAFPFVQTETCRVAGLLIKTKEGYAFTKDPNQPTQRILTFHDLDQLVTLFQASEKPFKKKVATEQAPRQPEPAPAKTNESAGGAAYFPFGGPAPRFGAK